MRSQGFKKLYFVIGGIGWNCGWAVAVGMVGSKFLS